MDMIREAPERLTCALCAHSIPAGTLYLHAPLSADTAGRDLHEACLFAWRGELAQLINRGDDPPPAETFRQVVHMLYMKPAEGWPWSPERKLWPALLPAATGLPGDGMPAPVAALAMGGCGMIAWQLHAQADRAERRYLAHREPESEEALTFRLSAHWLRHLRDVVLAQSTRDPVDQAELVQVFTECPEERAPMPCAYCDAQIPAPDTEEGRVQACRDHVLVCPEHPMRRVEGKLAAVHNALHEAATVAGRYRGGWKLRFPDGELVAVRDEQAASVYEVLGQYMAGVDPDGAHTAAELRALRAKVRILEERNTTLTRRLEALNHAEDAAA